MMYLSFYTWFTPEDVKEVGIPQNQVENFRQKFGEKYKVEAL